jgi:hypothetical protein
MAGEELLTISRDELERARLESEYKYELDRQCELLDALAEVAAAKEEAAAAKAAKEEAERLLFEGMRETARNLKAMGLPPDQIAQATGLAPGELP